MTSATAKQRDLVQDMLGIREWIEGLLGADGAEVTGGGIGMGGEYLGRADVEFNFYGRKFYLTVMDEGPGK